MGDENRVTIQASYGTITPYNENLEEFSNYAARVQLYFAANKVSDERRSQIFLACSGARTFALAVNAIAPKKIEDATYDEIMTALKGHFKPKTLVIFERFKYNSRVQGQGETIAEFVNGLKNLVRTCNYSSTVLNEMLRDRFVIGVNNAVTQQLLLTESQLTFEKAVALATAREAALRDSKMARNADAKPDNVHKVSGVSKAKRPGKQSIGQAAKSSASEEKPKTACFGCGGLHWKKNCPHKEAKCFACSKVGHIAAFCRTKDAKQTPSHNYKQQQRRYPSSHANKVHTVEDLQDDFFVGNVIDAYARIKPLYYDLILTPKATLTVELDTGSFHNLLSFDSYVQTWPNEVDRPIIKPYAANLAAYGGTKIDIVGQIQVAVRLSQADAPVQTVFVIVKQSGPALMGRALMKSLDLLVTQMRVNKISSIDNFVSVYKDLFSPGLGCYQGKTFTIEVDPTVSPKFYKARPLPYAMKEKVSQELSRLLDEGVITAVRHSKWACPVVPVLKADQSIRLCGDYKLTTNKAAKLDCYPIPNMKDLFSGLANMTIFSKLDLSQAYAQLKLHESSKELTTINTHRGLFEYNRLAFGISSAPGMFQRAMENLFQDLPEVICYLDDLLLVSSDEKQHELLLNKVFKRLQDNGLKLKAEKCAIGVPEVVYLGYTITKEGLLPTTTKVDAIAKAPAPKDITQLRSYLGLLNFYRKFIPRAATILEPLNRLLKADTKWIWNKEQQDAFETSKKVLLNSAALVHFDPKRPIIVSADSSSYGIGAVLSHDIEGIERPCHFVSRTLSETERRYSQTEKEALAIVYAMKQFHEYLWGQKFKMITDHKPILGIFSSNKPISPQASGRIQRWALLLQAYDFDLVHRSGKLLCTADMLSRLPHKTACENAAVPADWSNLINFMASMPIKQEMVRADTAADTLMSTVYDYTGNGWPAKTINHADLIHYSRRKDELSLQDGCLLWGTRVIIPPNLRQGVIQELHADHAGSSRMKELARSYLWWPNLDRDLENVASTCEKCLENRSAPPKAELHPWEWPEKPWHRIHVDFAGPVDNNYFLILVDAHSKWVDIYKTRGTSTADAIKGLRQSMAVFGLPVTIVSDNGPCFTSSEFKDFMQRSGVRHVTTAVYKPSTNGLAERMVRTFKNALKKSTESVNQTIDRFLFNYRVTPHATTGVSPAELMFGRKLRTRLDLLHSNKDSCVTTATPLQVASKVEAKQMAMKRNYCKRPRKTTISEKSPVMVRNYGKYGGKWLPATVERQTGPLSYRCTLNDGQSVKRHQDQLHKRSPSLSPAPPLVRIPVFSETNPPTLGRPSTPSRSEPSPVGDDRTIPRRSSRTRNPVDRYGDLVSH